MRKVSAKQRMADALLSGQSFTVPQARHRFGIQHVRGRIEELRDEGLDIQTLTGKTVRANGQLSKFYSL